MKALILKDKMQFVYGDVPKPVPAKNEVLIRIKAVSVCGSDIAGSDGSTGRRRPPIVMGHEASGIIEETGSKATRFAKGDRVTFDSTIYCAAGSAAAEESTYATTAEFWGILRRVPAAWRFLSVHRPSRTYRL